MPAYYNEIDPYAAQWLRNLIAAGAIAPGDVDERSIVDVCPADLGGFEQCHFFAGIGGWSHALRLAGWPDDRPVWTGSCPCQPFSAAGKGEAANDERHLWPFWFPLIAERRPATVFGEQVEAAIGWGWLDAVFTDLEGEGYACGATVLPACGVGAPHIRNRLWFVANAEGGRGDGALQPSEREGLSVLPRSGALSVMANPDGEDASAEGLQRGGEYGQRAEGGCADELGNPEHRGRQGRHAQGSGASSTLPSGEARDMGDTAGGGQREFRDAPQPGRGRYVDGAGVLNGFWRDAEWFANALMRGYDEGGRRT